LQPNGVQIERNPQNIISMIIAGATIPLVTGDTRKQLTMVEGSVVIADQDNAKNVHMHVSG